MQDICNCCRALRKICKRRRTD